MILGKKCIIYGLIGLFCIPLWAGEKKAQKNDILEKYWLIRQVSQEQGCPEELSKEIMDYAACTDEEMVKIQNFVRIVKDDLPNSVIRKHIFGLNEQQQEGLLHLIENGRYGKTSFGRQDAFTPDQYAKMEAVPSVFKKACGKQHALVEVPKSVVVREERIKGLVRIALWSMIGGIGGGAAFREPSIGFGELLGEPIKTGAYERMMLGAGAGAALGSYWFAVDEMDRIRYGTRNRDPREEMLFEQPRLPELGKDFMKELLAREKQWSRSMLLKE